MATSSTVSGGKTPPAPSSSDHTPASPTLPTPPQRTHSILGQKSGNTYGEIPSASSTTNSNNSSTGPPPLEIYRAALGIKPPKDPESGKTFIFLPKRAKSTKATDPNKLPITAEAHKGIYQQVISYERWANLYYTLCNIFMNLSMFLQIVIGAALTAFGAGSADHTLVTVFGAANTAIASILAVLKSRGLPNRLRQDWIEWRELREFIEETEMDIKMDASEKVGVRPDRPTPVNVWDTIRTIEARFNAVRLTCEANRPDTYVKVPPKP